MKEPHSGIFFRRYKDGKPAGIAIEIMFRTVEVCAEFIQKEYMGDEDRVYHIEDTYGNCLAVVTKNEIRYCNY